MTVYVVLKKFEQDGDMIVDMYVSRSAAEAKRDELERNKTMEYETVVEAWEVR